MLTAASPNDVTLDMLGADYPALIEHVMYYGSVEESRIGKTREIPNMRLTLRDPYYALVERATMNDRFAYEEMTQILAGIYDGDRIAAIIPRAGELLASPTAYGPRAWPQLLYVCEELEVSPDSRRAVVYIGRDDDLEALRSHNESVARKAEMPCTLTWQFLLRRGHLNMYVTMRSWDLVWGLSYDVPSFVAVQLAVAEHLGVPVGEYQHTSGSAHIYDRHWGVVGAAPRHDTLDLYLDDLVKGSILETKARCLERVST